MGKITAVIPDELEMQLRKKSFDLNKGKRGGISEIVTEAIELWLKKAES